MTDRVMAQITKTVTHMEIAELPWVPRVHLNIRRGVSMLVAFVQRTFVQLIATAKGSFEQWVSLR